MSCYYFYLHLDSLPFFNRFSNESMEKASEGSPSQGKDERTTATVGIPVHDRNLTSEPSSNQPVKESPSHDRNKLNAPDTHKQQVTDTNSEGALTHNAKSQKKNISEKYEGDGRVENWPLNTETAENDLQKDSADDSSLTRSSTDENKICRSIAEPKTIADSDGVRVDVEVDIKLSTTAKEDNLGGDTVRDKLDGAEKLKAVSLSDSKLSVKRQANEDSSTECDSSRESSSEQSPVVNNSNTSSDADAADDIVKFQTDSGEPGDVLLNTGDRKFLCQKSVLCRRCPYFEAMFASGMKESDAKEVHLENVNSRYFQSLLNYLFMCHLDVSPSNVEGGVFLLSTEHCAECWYSAPPIIRL
jgi:hypothetical protein